MDDLDNPGRRSAARPSDNTSANSYGFAVASTAVWVAPGEFVAGEVDAKILHCSGFRRGLGLSGSEVRLQSDYVIHGAVPWRRPGGADRWTGSSVVFGVAWTLLVLFAAATPVLASLRVINLVDAMASATDGQSRLLAPCITTSGFRRQPSGPPVRSRTRSMNAAVPVPGGVVRSIR
jgi:hypothetical protein